MARDPVKTARRASLRARRRDLAAARDTARDDRDLAEHVGALLDTLGLGPGSVVTSYASIPGEPPTARVNAMLAERGIRVLLPITLPDLDLDWHDAADPDEQPLGRDAVARVDLVLAPGLAVDHSGTRMGQGGGCYDRALTRCDPQPPTVVLLHPGELVAVDDAPLPREPHDRGVDAVLTAQGLVDLGISPWSSPRGAG